MKIAVVEGQGGGIGRIIIEKLRLSLGPGCTIIALGTNAIATSVMLKAGANEGATGENAVVQTVKKVDIVLGSVAILAANAFLGELTPRMAEAIASSDARKILIPLNRNNIEISGSMDEPLPRQVDQLIETVRVFMARQELRNDERCC